MSILKVDTINEKTSGNGVAIPGHVVQVVTGTITSETQVTSNTLVDTGLSVTITPKFNTSKIFISVSNLGICYATQYVRHKLLRGSTVICGDFAYNNNNYWMPVNFAMSILDSPATTSATTYKTQIGASANGDLRYNYGGDGTGSNASITAMEIAV
tara:strand:+ start:917 stop:1384 length:468 start_codon:yes stop_codon:yes gene_type:complete